MKKPRAYTWIQNLLPALANSLKKTAWFLQLTMKNCIKSWKNIQRLKIYSLIEWSEMFNEAKKLRINKKITHEKRKGIQRKI